MGISFLCSLLESVLMSTPLSYITMKEDEGDKNAALFMKFKQDPDHRYIPLERPPLAFPRDELPGVSPLPHRVAH